MRAVPSSRPTMLIERLADRTEQVTMLATSFVEEWAPYYDPEGPGDGVADRYAACSRKAVPLALVTREGGRVLRTAAIRESSFASHRGFVHPEDVG